MTENCSICTDEIQNKNVMILECSHKFHCSCSFQMFSHNHFQCPLCRNEIEYKVPESDLQRRLMEKEHQTQELGHHIALVSIEMGEMTAKIQSMNQVISRLNREKRELVLKNELVDTVNELEKQQIKQDYDVKIFKLIQEKNYLREKIKISEGTSSSKKNNEINKLKKQLENERKKAHELGNSLEKVISNNIELAERNNEIFSEINRLLSRVQADNTSMRIKSRIHEHRGIHSFRF